MLAKAVEVGNLLGLVNGETTEAALPIGKKVYKKARLERRTSKDKKANSVCRPKGEFVV